MAPTEAPTEGPPTSGCGVKRVRRNVNKLDPDERQRLVVAMQALIGNGTRYVDIANYHGAPPNICNGHGCCPHNNPTFYPWHRLYMAKMEDELGEGLPYWDWTENGTIPDLWEGIRAPIKEGVQSSCGGGQSVTRSPDNPQINFERQRSMTEDAMRKTKFVDFQDAIGEGPHGNVHIDLKCDMKPPAIAAYDTVFWLHHSYVDYQWAYWQELQRIRIQQGTATQEETEPQSGEGESRPNRENQTTIEIFDFTQPFKPYNNESANRNAKTLQTNLGTDTYDYRNNLCYEYDTLIFNGLTPEQYLEGRANLLAEFNRNLPEENTCSRIGENGEALCNRNGNPDKVTVGVVLPKQSRTGLNTFDICQEEKCVEGGSVASFGDSSRAGNAGNAGSDYQASGSGSVDDDNTIKELDVTDVVAEQGFSLDKPIEVKIKSGVADNMLDPVTMFRKLGKDGGIAKDLTEIFTNPGTDPSQYGNLLKGLGGKISEFVKGAVDDALTDAGLNGDAGGNAAGDAGGDAGGDGATGADRKRRIKRKKRH